jgi:hypothetical protein
VEAVAPVVVGATTGLVSTIALVALGETNGYENLLIVSVLMLLTTFATAYGMTGRITFALLVSSLCTLLTVGVGFALSYIFFSWMCGSHPSAC